MRKKHLGDLILVLVLLAVSLLLLALFVWNKGDGSGIVGAVDGKEIARYSLAENGTYILNGGTNTITVENGTVRMTEAACPDHLCVHQGKISGAGQVITCLPNRLTVTVFGAKGEVDLIS